MNITLCKKTHSYAIALLAADDEENDEVFIRVYNELKALCYEHEGDDHSNYPLQWETLADFTEQADQALIYYEKALAIAQTIQANDYIVSVSYAMATILLEKEQKELALVMALQANKFSKEISNRELQVEIKALLKLFREDKR
jgi:hypothetical protein